MNKFKLVLFTIFLISFCWISCETDKQEGPFEIYYLADTTLSYSDIEETSLPDIVIESEPVITADDILEYWIKYIPDNPIRTHVLFLNEDKKEKLGDIRRPYVVLANYKKIYAGEYWPQPSGGECLQGITMIHMTENRYDIMSNTESDNDLMNDDNIISALEYSGIEIVYDDISD